MSIIAFAAFFLSAIGALILVIPLALELVPSRLRGHLPWAEELVMVAIAIPLLLAAGIGALRVRDVLLGRLLREALRGRLKKLRCPGCRYSLIGLRVSGDVVRCPECGGAVTLAELGLDSPDDLLPPVDAPPHDDPEAGARSAPD
ncbi:MAG: hypothetical protein KAS72_13645 [Phycisphaerales bacterium]|nr:hypothetical protein [Phycisphaerales bacterium]